MTDYLIKGQKASRQDSLSLTGGSVLRSNQEDRTVELAFSSEFPYERSWGVEILDHSDASVDLSRLRSGGAVLMDHNLTDHVGVVEDVRIDSDQ